MFDSKYNHLTSFANRLKIYQRFESPFSAVVNFPVYASYDVLHLTVKDFLKN